MATIDRRRPRHILNNDDRRQGTKIRNHQQIAAAPPSSEAGN